MRSCSEESVAVVPALLGDPDPGLLGEGAHRFDERQLFVFHHEGKDVPPHPAAEAMEHLLLGAHGERGGLFLVERAEADEVLAAFLQADDRADHVHDVGGVADVVDDGIWDAHGRIYGKPREGKKEKGRRKKEEGKAQMRRK